MYISASAPDAPPFSDTTIGCFIRLFFWIAACIIRAIWSDAPPAPAATTISTGFVGSQASAELIASRPANAPAFLTNVFIAGSSSGHSGSNDFCSGCPARGIVLVGSAFTQERERFDHAARAVRDVFEGKPHLDAAQRSAQHEIVEPAQVTDREHAPCELAETRPERQIEAREDLAPQRVGIMPVGHQ